MPKRLAKRRPRADPLKLADTTIGPALARISRLAITHAPSRADAIALLLVSPDFLRR